MVFSFYGGLCFQLDCFYAKWKGLGYICKFYVNDSFLFCSPFLRFGGVKMICPICDEEIVEPFEVIDGYATHCECLERARLKHE